MSEAGPCGYRARLMQLFAGELDPAARREVESHRAGCTACQGAWREWQSAAQAAPPARAVWASVQARTGPRRRWTWPVVAALAPVAAAWMLWVRAPASSEAHRYKGDGAGWALVQSVERKGRKIPAPENFCPGDVLLFSVTAPEEAFAYLYWRDERGHTERVFPKGPTGFPIAVGANPLPVSLRLDAAPGAEAFTLVVAGADRASALDAHLLQGRASKPPHHAWWAQPVPKDCPAPDAGA